MNLTYQERQELNALSKKAFGSSSRWQKLITKGFAEPVERQREVMVPNKKGVPTMKTFTDKKKVVRHYTVEELRKLMEEVIALNTSAIVAPEQVKIESNIPYVGPPLPVGVPMAQADGSTITVTTNEAPV